MTVDKIILFENADKSVKLDVPMQDDSVWLNRQQLAMLFDRDVKTIGKHINHALSEELDDISEVVVAKIATTGMHIFLGGISKISGFNCRNFCASSN